MIDNSDQTVSFKSKASGLYVTAIADDGGKLMPRATTIQDWEKFMKETLPDGTIALRALANNKYVSVDPNNGSFLIANRDIIGGAWEAFRVVRY